MIQARGELLREPGKKGRRAAAAYLRPRTVERAWELFQSGSEMDAQDLMPQADPQHRNIRRQAAQQAEGSPVAGIVHHARTGGEDDLFPLPHRVFQAGRIMGDHARNGHARGRGQFREVPGKGIPVIDDPDVRLTHGAHMIK